MFIFCYSPGATSVISAAMASHESLLTPKLLDSLYTESMVLADEVRSHFDSNNFENGYFQDGQPIDSELSIGLSCESLKVTTRLMHCIAWLLDQKALHNGDLTPGEVWQVDRMLGYSPAGDKDLIERFPAESQSLILASEDLYDRLQRLQARLHQNDTPVPEVHKHLSRIRDSF